TAPAFVLVHFSITRTYAFCIAGIHLSSHRWNYLGELRLWQTLLFIVIIVATFFAFITFHLPGMYLTGAIALIEIVLILMIFKSDIRVK
ncbi:MAG: hypothetical protein ABI443_11460, partial [Chthoniobacterales bacterium]